MAESSRGLKNRSGHCRYDGLLVMLLQMITASLAVRTDVSYKCDEQGSATLAALDQRHSLFPHVTRVRLAPCHDQILHSSVEPPSDPGRFMLHAPVNEFAP